MSNGTPVRAIVLIVSAVLAGALDGGPMPRPPATDAAAALTRKADYLRVKGKARAWLDRLDVDTAELTKHGIKGKKKLAEILDAYLGLHQHAADPVDRDAIAARVRALAAQTARPDYHNMATCPETELLHDSMSYLRVVWLLKQFGHDIGGYREKVLAMKPRLDRHLPRRGPWQQAMFVEYYDRLGLEKPPALARKPLEAGVISSRLPASQYTDDTTYNLTHEVFVAYDYGLRRSQDRFKAEDLAYTRRTLPELALRYVAEKNVDLLGEILSCMTYLGWHSDPAYQKTADFLLDSQNENGSWGNYERYRKDFGRYLEHHVYLHTTMVVLGALIEAYEGGWKRSE